MQEDVRSLQDGTSVIAGAREPAAAVSLDDLGGLGDSPVLRFGSKATNLARARQHGLSTLPGVVLPVELAVAFRQGDGEVSNAWIDATARLARETRSPLVVRSSSPNEDTDLESQAGRYTSVVGVVDQRGVRQATAQVIDSGDGAMAVLAQPMVDAVHSGVLFGMDPVSGRRDRIVVAAVNGLPQQLVSGETAATQYQLSRHGRIRSVDRPADIPPAVLAHSQLRSLARLARRVSILFGGPQDVEWAIDGQNRLWLLQSRPVTTLGPEPAGRAVFGTAGVDETFPDALTPLEEDLWVPPLARGLRDAIEITQTFPRRAVAESQAVTTVGGQVVIDQLLVGNIPVRSHWFDPRPGFRRLSVAWRVGRVRGAIVPLAARALARADLSLASLPEPALLDNEQLLGAIRRAGDGLGAVHGMEMLAGTMVPHTLVDAGLPTGMGTAADLLARNRGSETGRHRSDDELIAEFPSLLALLPPRIGGRAPLPVSTPLPGTAPPELDGATPAEQTPAGSTGPEVGGRATEIALVRESLRLRARWLQEAQSAMVAELAGRLVDDGVMANAELVRMLRQSELDAAVRTGRIPDDLEARSNYWHDRGGPLPMRFRLSSENVPIPVAEPPAVRSGEVGVVVGQGGSPGRGRGRVTHDPAHAGPGVVLVTTTLDPRLAPILPQLSALVSETGSPLSHLAIVAREHHMPLVIGVTGALSELPEGAEIEVDGASGAVRTLERSSSGGELPATPSPTRAPEEV